MIIKPHDLEIYLCTRRYRCLTMLFEILKNNLNLITKF
jgi:hypothetical protein